MRWFLSAVAALLVSWCGYMASPYIALRTLATAVQDGDFATVAEKTNSYALRLSLARQLAEEEIKLAGRPAQLSSSDQQLAAVAVAMLADPLMQQFLTPAGIARLLRDPVRARTEGAASTPPSRDSSAVPGEDRALSPAGLGALLGASRWRGFRNVYFTLPPAAPAEARFRLQLRFSRLAWRLVGVDLPPGLRQRLGRDLLRRTDP